MRQSLVFSLAVLGTLALHPSLSAQVERQTPATSFGSVGVAISKLRLLVEQPAPAGLSPQDGASYQAHTEWLKSVIARLEHTIKSPRDMATGQASGKQAGGQPEAPPSLEVTAPRDRSAGQASGRQQVAAILSPDMDLLKRAIEEESLRFTSVSNVLKTRHDVAMNAIRNMK